MVTVTHTTEHKPRAPNLSPLPHLLRSLRVQVGVQERYGELDLTRAAGLHDDSACERRGGRQREWRRKKGKKGLRGGGGDGG